MRPVVLMWLAAALVFGQAEQAEPPKKGTITGIVYSAAGEPLRKADVTARRLNSRDYLSQGTKVSTEQNGSYKLADLEPGEYTVSATKTGYVNQTWGAPRNSSLGAVVRIAAGQEVKDVDFRLPTQGVVAGKVVDDEGEPVQKVMVMALQQRYARGKKLWLPAGNAQVNDLGEYRIAGLKPGTYLFQMSPVGGPMELGTAAAADGMGYVLTWYPDATDQSQATPVEVTTGGELRSIDFRVKKVKTYSISGKVLDTTGAPAVQSIIAVIPNSEAVTAQSQRISMVGEGGKFTIGGLSPGSWMVFAQGMAGGTRNITRTEVTISDASVKDVVLNFGSGNEVTARLRVEGPVKLDPQNMVVALEPVTGSMFMAAGGLVGADGTLKVENAGPMKYRIRVQPQQDAYVKSVRFGGQETTDGLVDMSGGASGVLDVLLSTNGGTIEGVVQDPKKRPTGRVTVVLVPDKRDDHGAFRATASDDKGAFRFTALPPGNYKVFAWEEIEEGSWHEPSVLSRVEADGKALAVKEGSRDNVTIAYIVPQGGSMLERENDEREKKAKQ